MAEYIERDALRDEILNDPTFDNDTINYYLDVVDSQPTADVVEVVRCKDCKNYEQYATGCDEMVCGLDDLFRNPDEFCSYGERRREE